MTRSDLLHIKGALEAVQTELEQLMVSEDWFVTEVVDQVESALQIIEENLNGNEKESN